jgi:hypothetical protein
MTLGGHEQYERRDHEDQRDGHQVVIGGEVHALILLQSIAVVADPINDRSYGRTWAAGIISVTFGMSASASAMNRLSARARIRRSLRKFWTTCSVVVPASTITVSPSQTS